MVSPGTYIKTLHNLGWWNVIYAAWYKFSLKSGIRKNFLPVKQFQTGTFFKEVKNEGYDISDFHSSWENKLLNAADNIIKGKISYFFAHIKDMDSPPDWFRNPFNNETVSNPQEHWTKLGDFDLNIGDVKIIWEPSRFNWVLVLSRAYALTKDKRYLNTLNDWLNDWIEKNPLYIGPNWKCGQETSIRIMHLILAAKILGQYEEPSKVLQHFIRLHLERVRGNINYAIAQDNNHGTSETAALYIGSTWLLRTNPADPELEKWQLKGRKLLENRIEKLIKYDGTFSQYSITYHRMVLDTMSWVLWNEKQLNIPKKISNSSLIKIERALLWLKTLIDHKTGAAPNFGPNDGAYICKLHSNDYRDFWPSIRLLTVLLGKPIDRQRKEKDEALFWLEIDSIYNNTENGRKKLTQPVYHLPESGIVRINGNKSWLLFHYPRYEFRPSHCDFLHVDVWHEGKNILRDSGSYCYNTDNEEFDKSYFSSIKSHNTVSFDHEEPIQKIGHFLYADWPQAEQVSVDPEKKYCQAQYRFGDKVNHKRSIEYIHTDHWKIVDMFEGDFEVPVLWWRLMPGDWKINSDQMTAEGEHAKIIIKADSDLQLNLEEGMESWYYMQYSKLPVLTAKGGPGTRKIESYIELK